MVKAKVSATHKGDEHKKGELETKLPSGEAKADGGFIIWQQCIPVVLTMVLSLILESMVPKGMDN